MFLAVAIAPYCADPLNAITLNLVSGNYITPMREKI